MKQLLAFAAFLFLSSAFGQRYVSSYNTIDEAWAANLNNSNTNIYISGGSTANDGRGGLFWYEKNATTTTNRGMVFGNKYGGRLFRVWDKQVDPRWFGADDSCAAVATTQIQEAIDFAARPTYGWQKTSGESSGGVNNSAFGVELLGCFWTDAPLYVRGGVDFHGAKQGALAGDNGAHAIIQSRHSGHCIIWDFVSDPSNFYRQPTIRSLFLTGYSETFKSGKKAITGVSSRTVFTVADADAPPTIDDITLAAANNTCMFYDAEGGYLGSGRVVSTSSAAGQTTVTLQSGSDVYTSVNATSGNLLTTACKVAWWNRVTDENALGVGTFNDPSGICAIFLKSTYNNVVTMPRIVDVYATRFDTGLRIGPNILGGGQGVTDFRAVRCRFAGMSFPRPYNTPDIEFNGTIYCTGYYGADYGATRTFTADIPGLRQCTYGIYAPPGGSKWANVLVEQNAYANIYFLRPNFTTFSQIFADNIIRYGVAFGPSYRAYVSPSTSAEDNWVIVGNLKTRTQLGGLAQDTMHLGDSGAVKFELTDTAKFNGLSIGSFEAFAAAAQTNLMPWAFDLQSAAYNNRVKIAQVVERNGVTNWVAAGSKLPEVGPQQLASPTETGNGFYQTPGANQIDLAINSGRVASFTSSKSKFSNSTGVDVLSLSNDSNSREVTFSMGTDSLSIDNKTNSSRFASLVSLSTDTALILGYSQNPTPGTIRGSALKAEGSSGTDQGSGSLQIYGAPGTGAGASGGTIDFYTSSPGASGSSAQTSTIRAQIGRYGGIRFIGQAADPSIGVLGNAYFNSTINNFKFYDGNLYVPLSIQGAEQSTASASTVNLAFTSTDKVNITGTTTISSFGPGLSGYRRQVRFAGALTLTYNATSMILPTGVDIVTEAGDTLEAQCVGSSNWIVVWYQRASGAPLVVLSPFATISVDASATFTFLPTSGTMTRVLTAPITANRTVTLSTTSAKNGQIARFTRTSASTGAFNWDIGGLKSLTVGQWCEVGFDGSAWVLLQYGSL